MSPTVSPPSLSHPAASFSVSAQGELEIVVRRTFLAPRAQVFAACTEPLLLRRWMLGPPGWTMPVCEIDLCPGGTYRMLWRNESGEEMGMHGVYREIVPPERVVDTEVFEQSWYSGEALRTLELTEQDGRTALKLTLRYESRQARDTVLASQMEVGVAAGYARLDELLAGPAFETGERAGGGLEQPRVVTMAARPVALLHLTVPRDQIRHVMGPGLAELRAAVAAQGAAESGPWFTHHLRMAPDVFDFEIGVPVAAPIAPAGRVRPGEWPAGAAVQALYPGPYEGLGAAWAALDSWMKRQGHAGAVDLWERYVTEPAVGRDAASCVTELTRPLAVRG